MMAFIPRARVIYVPARETRYLAVALLAAVGDGRRWWCRWESGFFDKVLDNFFNGYRGGLGFGGVEGGFFD